MYSFTDRYLAEELAGLARRGVRIRLYRDRQQYEEEQHNASERKRPSTTEILRGQATSICASRRAPTHALESLPGRWPAAARRFRQLVSHRPQAAGQQRCITPPIPPRSAPSSSSLSRCGTALITNPYSEVTANHRGHGGTQRESRTLCALWLNRGVIRFSAALPACRPGGRRQRSGGRLPVLPRR